MAAQGERVSGAIGSCNVLGPMVQDISEQDIVMGELELPPQMDPKPEMAAACDTSPSLLRNPPPIPTETAQQSGLDIILQAINKMNEKMEVKMEKMMFAHSLPPKLPPAAAHRCRASRC